MQDTAKYLVHADITTDGIVERSDVVGAVFGQTEGLLGDELDLHELQDSSKVGRIDVEINSENGQSFGRITIATSLDQVETAILAAALETITRVGPCRSTIEVRSIEDVRAAKRREVVERAKTLLSESFDDAIRSSRDLVEEVREAIRIEDITDYEGLPAGPNINGADAIVIVEGRADVLTLLRYGIKNAIAVEGTNVPEVVAALTEERTVTAFLDGDRGGELILKELAQVGDIDYVAFAPADRSVEDLARNEVMAALREKVPYDRVADADNPSEIAAPPPLTDAPPDSVDVVTPSRANPHASGDDHESAADPEAARHAETQPAVRPLTPPQDTDATPPEQVALPEDAPATDAPPAGQTDTPDTPGEAETDHAVDHREDAETEASTAPADDQDPDTVRGHVTEIIGGDSDRVRFLADDCAVIDEAAADDAFDRLESADTTPAIVILDGPVTQRLLDVAGQRGVDQIIAAATGEFVKKPTSVRVRTADDLLTTNEA